FTTQTNQTIEANSTVDIGYHYVATDQYGNPLETYTNNSPDYLVDANGNGLPDSWEWYWFGSYAYSGTNLDGNGNTLLYDYMNGIDPTIIVFSIQVTNNYVNTSFVPAQLNVSGIPSYIAICVDDTNFSNDATWNTYTSTNITIALGSTEGWHEIWVGLKGFSTNAQPAWEWKRLKLDLTPPCLVVTNPLPGTVMQPMIELQGYCPEPLAAISYDITNATGLLTNQQVLVLDQFYDTNTWDFTTNTFQGFDIPLTNGLNVITIHAMDLAGSVTTTNLNFTLDYSGKTNPPVVQLYWPQDGMTVCDSNFLWSGRVDDPMAKVTAQWVDSSGATNLVDGLVGRDGRFFVYDLPLTNLATFTLKVADAAGNMSMTNMTINLGDSGLSIDPVIAGQTTVTGQISSSDYTVWVNGAQAVVSDGAWSADVAPISGEGGTVEAMAIPNSDNGGNGNGETDEAGNPQSAQGQSAQTAVDAPQGVYVASCSSGESQDYLPDHSVTNHDDDVIHWQDGGGGSATIHLWDEDHNNGTWPETITWPSSIWPQAMPYGTLWADFENDDVINSTFFPASEDFIYASIGVKAKDALTGTSFEETAQPELKFSTGGPPGSTVQRLYVFWGGVTEVLNPGPPNRDHVPWGEWSTYVTAANEDVSLGELGKEDSDGNVYALLSDNKRVVVTPHVDGQDFYDFGPPSFASYTLIHLTECTAPGNTNNARTTIGIGEVVDFSGMPANTTWSVSGNGTISSTNGSGTTFTASLTPGSATVTAKIDDVTIPTTFGNIAPSSLIVLSITDSPPGTENTNGTTMGAETIYTDVIGSTNVSFYKVDFRENPDPATMSVTWPNGTNTTIRSDRATSPWGVSCGNSTVFDTISAPEVPISYLFNGTNYVDFSFTSSWTDQYKNEGGAWINFYTLTAKYEYRGSDKKCRVTYLDVAGGWQGPF
ncbi:MAG: hypothetical protein ACREFE_13630, partial [Limisphaerales bacterium]